MNDLAEKLINSRDGDINWTGRLSDSALATAVSVFALCSVDSRKYSDNISRGLEWLVENINSDGGWGDTTASFSNISTTLLCWAAFEKAAPEEVSYRSTVERCKLWVRDYCGSLLPEDIASAVYRRYDNDRTFSAPIMTIFALSGLLGTDKQAWQNVYRLPFELSVFPQKMYSQLGLPVVSYALPALIAIGQVGHHFNPTANPILRFIRSISINRSLAKLSNIQPSNGGFLEAAPLTAFVTASLSSKGVNNSVVQKGVDFLLASQRENGSWPIDTDLALWLTTLSVNVLADSGNLSQIPHLQREQLASWLISCQYTKVHPYTGSAAGGWGWTNKPGAVPDADDTSGAVLALVNLLNSGVNSEGLEQSVIAGVKWLLGVKNKDGGVPTFCRGWGKLPFDRSCCDITAHAIIAWTRALEHISDNKFASEINQAILQALNYLKSQQDYHGWWRPLWFGCQYMPDDTNEVYGTAKVISALAGVSEEYLYLSRPMIEKAAHWLASVQRPNGGFSGGLINSDSDSQQDICTIEETALAVYALKRAVSQLPNEKQKKTDTLIRAIESGTDYLQLRWKNNPEGDSAPIGLYFAKLWYYEELYPLIFSVQAQINK